MLEGEPDCQGSSWLLLQVPGSLKAPGPLKGGRAKPRAALFQQQENPTLRPSPVLPQQSSKAGPGPGGRTDCGEVEERLRGRVVLWGGEEDTGESLKQGQEATVLRCGHYTKASWLEDPLSLRKSLSSSLFCCSCLSSWRR